MRPHNSRAFVEHLRETGELSQVEAMVNVDMIGDCLLGIRRDKDAPKWLTLAIWGTAKALGHAKQFVPFSRSVEDTHIPFRRAGIPAVNVIDFSYGGDHAQHVENWHTENDAMDLVCAESLQVVGDVIYHALFEIDACLRTRGRQTGGRRTGGRRTGSPPCQQETNLS